MLCKNRLFMRILDEPSLTWDEWNDNKPKRQFDREKFTTLSIVEKDEQVKNLICELADCILSVSNPMKILLYGSRARGDAQVDSDIDLTVIFKRKRDITRKYRNLISTLIKTSPINVDFKSASVQEIKNSRENMDNVYYYVMRDSIIIYQQGDNGLYNFLKKAHIFLDWAYNSSTLKTASGFESYVVIKQSLGAVFLACHRPMPANMSSLQNIADQLPVNWNVCKLCNKDELDYITKLIKPTFGTHNDKDPIRSYKIAKKIYDSVLNECIERNLLPDNKIAELHQVPVKT